MIRRTFDTPRSAIRELCILKAEVAEKVFGYRHASDCICGDPGSLCWVAGASEWPDKPNPLTGWHEDGVVMDWIRDAINEKIARETRKEQNQ